MSNQKILLSFLSITMATMLVQCTKSTSPEIPNYYCNQPPPGITPELYAPEIFASTGGQLHGFPAIAPAGNEIHWPVLPPKILYVTFTNGEWSQPETASCSTGNIQAPVYSADGKKLFFQLSDPAGFGSLDICYIEQTDTGWSAKKNLGQPPNTAQLESQPSFTHSGTVYYTGYYQHGLWGRGIYRSVFRAGKYEKPQLLPATINTKYLDYTPFIAADESFLLFSSSRPTMDESALRLYVSFRDSAGNWSTPHNLNDLMEFDQPSRFPCLTPDNKFIIFLSGNKYYWVSSKILELCRPE
ncbi:MAG: hypothetical protein ABIA75_02615 [Candidatus Neomarinimicrobiota bacterium]